MNFAISAEHLFMKFADRPVLKDISFQVPAGTVFGLLGPSGAGKTTLIRILTGQLLQDGGRAELLGRDTRKLTALEQVKIGAMMDDYGLYERLSVYDNLAFYADIYRVGRHTVYDVLKSVGLYEARKITVSKLSKGMKNRLSLGRALLNQAKILFLDEPTSGLDPVTTKEIHKILEEQKKKGTTIFLTTHNMFEAESLCDHVILLHQGSIIEEGNPADLCRKYNHLNQLHITLKGGKEVTVANGSASAGAVKEYLEKDMIEAIHSTEPTLETVFIELTGRRLA